MSEVTMLPDGGALRWRGVMLDVARHFLPIGEVRRIMAWRDWTDAAGRASRAGVDVVQAPSLLYLDHANGAEEGEPLSIGPGATLEDVYAYDPYAGIGDPSHLLGLQAQLWSEYIPTADHLWYMAFPRLVAMADVGWYGSERPPYEEFLAGLPARLADLADVGIGHRPLE